MSFLDKLGGIAKNIGDKTGEMLTVRYAPRAARPLPRA